ncbi:hypothetical protein C8J56DRAFT_1110140 [Mycena floridula]|nr:hypothetical protein C8J56DRAFT_1110140 [Mycena floridula]
MSNLPSWYIPGPTGFQQLVAATVISFNPVSRDYTSHLAFIFSLFAHIAASFWFLGLAGKHGYLTAASRLLVNTVAEPVFIFARFCLLFVLVDVKMNQFWRNLQTVTSSGVTLRNGTSSSNFGPDQDFITRSGLSCSHQVFPAVWDRFTHELARSLLVMKAALDEHGPIHVYFDNVGGEALEAALEATTLGSRLVMCGHASYYGTSLETRQGVRNTDLIFQRRLTLKGYLVPDTMSRLLPRFLEEMPPLLAAGKLKSQEHIYEGLEKAPQAFVDMMTGGDHLNVAGKPVIMV